MRNGIKLIFFSALVAVLIGFSQQYISSNEENYVIPQDTLITPTITKVEVETIIISPDIIKVVPKTNDFTTSFSTESISYLPTAGAISASEQNVALTEWVVREENIQLHGIDVDSSDKVYFSSNNDAISEPNSNQNIIGRLNPTNNEITQWLITLSNSGRMRGVAVDSSDSVFFIDHGRNKIGLLNPTNNEVKLWDIPTSNAGPFSVTVDSSDNAFFTELDGNKIGRLNPTTNEITEWEIPTLNSNPFGITSDSSDMIFFTENDAAKIGRLNPSTNTITEWSLNTFPANLHGVAADSSDLIYFAEGAGGLAIGRLNPTDNSIKEWDLPNGGLGIALDSADVAYVSEGSDTKNIGRLVPSTDTKTNWALPSSSSNVNFLAIDSSDDVFFTEDSSGKIGRLSSLPP